LQNWHIPIPILIISKLNERSSPSLASMYLAAIPVAPLAEYTPRARRDIPPAAAIILSQSARKAWAPVPSTDPAVLHKTS